MSARWCADCKIKYPSQARFLQCPVHETDTDYLPYTDLHVDWHIRAAQVRDDMAMELRVPKIEGVPVRDYDGYFAVDSRELIRAGYHNRLEPHDLIRVEGQVYEVLEYVDQRREYLLRRFSFRLTDEELKRLAKGQGPKRSRKRQT